LLPAAWAQQKRGMTDEPEQNSESGPVSVPASDRRAHPRQRIRSLAYVHLGEGNGGIILNISEGGIGVQAAEALDEGEGVIGMRIEIPRSRKRLEVRGEIMWVGESRKEAGLRFVDLQEDALRRIRSWMAREESPGTAPEDSEEDVEAPVVRAAEDRAETVVAEESSARAENSIAEGEQITAGGGEQSSEVDETAQEDFEPVEFDEEPVAFDEEALDEPVDASRVSPAEVGQRGVVTMEASSGVTEKFRAAAPATCEEEDPAQKVAPSVAAPVVTSFVPFDKQPQIPATPYTPISGTHGAPAFAVAAPAPAPARYSGGDAAASLFPNPRVPVEPTAAAADGGWKSFRVQLQSGWFLAALVLLLATISFVAGMAVRRGALNAMMGDVDDVAQPKRASAPSSGNLTGNLAANPAGNGWSAAASAAPATPLQIEIVDLENHRWTIPATNGANHSDAGAARQAELNEAAPSDGGAPSSAASHVPATNQNSAQGTGSNGATDAGAAAKPRAPLMLSLPETPISASGSIAIRATGMVPMPGSEAESGQHARNLQIGQLANMVEPVYPPDARQAHLEGTVKLHVVVGANGEVQSFRTVSGPESLAQAAMLAVREWRYRPTLLNGKAVETQEDVTFVFRLPN
jgi:TonB family protein